MDSLKNSKRTVLRPSFTPPDPAKFFHASPFDRQGILLRLVPDELSPFETPHVADAHMATRPHAKAAAGKRSAKAVTGVGGQELSLFGGEIKVPKDTSKDSNSTSIANGNKRKLESTSDQSAAPAHNDGGSHPQAFFPIFDKRARHFDEEDGDRGEETRHGVIKESDHTSSANSFFDKKPPGPSGDSFSDSLRGRASAVWRQGEPQQQLQQVPPQSSRGGSKKEGGRSSSTQSVQKPIGRFSDPSVLDSRSLSPGVQVLGASREAADAFLRTLQQQSGGATASLAIVCNDNHFSSNLDVTSTKYCTPSRACSGCGWGCDQAPRIAPTRMAPLAILIRMHTVASTSSSRSSIISHNDDIIDCSDYVLPLCERWSFDSMAGGREMSIEDRWSLLMEILNSSCEKIVYNLQLFLLPILYHYSWHTRRGGLAANESSASSSHPLLLDCSGVFDPRLAAYMVDSDASAAELELAPLLGKYAVVMQDSLDAADAKLSVFRRIDKIFRSMQACKELRDILQDVLATTKCTSVFKQLEIPLVKTLCVMEVRGVCVSIDELDREHAAIEEVKRAISVCASLVARQTINLLSPEQVAHLLYDELHLPKPATSTAKAKHASTSEEDLSKIRHLHPIVDLILFYRSMAKISGTYIEGIKPYTLDTDIKGVKSIHACWNQTIVSTGRLSCSRPNLQNLPKDPIPLDDIAAACCDILVGDSDGPRKHAPLIARLRGVKPIISRSIIMSRPGSVLLSADYSQIEMRIMAHVSGDEELRGLFQHSGDVYVLLASRIFDKSIDAVSKVEREQAKVICLGVIYGMGARTAAERLKVEVARIVRIMDSFFRKFSRLKQWLHEVKSDVVTSGFVSTIFGRRRFLRGITSTDSGERSRAERQAVNAIIQGSASDLIKYAMVQVERRLDTDYGFDAEDRNLRPRIVMQIHDELIYEVPLAVPNGPPEQDLNVIRFNSFLSELMTQDVVKELGIQVPLKTSISVGYKWGLMTKSEARMDRPPMSSVDYSAIMPPLSESSVNTHRVPFTSRTSPHGVAMGSPEGKHSQAPSSQGSRGKRSVD